MIEKEVIDAIANVGFPIFVSLYTLLKIDKTVANNTLVLQKFVDKFNE